MRKALYGQTTLEGPKCHGDRYERNTIINFVCKEGSGNGLPVFVDETDDCTYYFSWHTELACEEKVIISESGFVITTKYPFLS